MDRFLLGINNNKDEYQWVFDSDESPVTWMSWVEWKDYDSYPRYEDGRNCVSMVRQRGEEYDGHRTHDWINFPCESTDFIDARPKSLVCQKSIGESCLL